MEFETVCGLEVHTELSTSTKIFCSCSTRFGVEPNTHCCEVCTGLPGSLPVLNERVLEFAVKCALALNCKISARTQFDRKNYFYPDLPKAYQISQLYMPIGTGGWVEINDSISGGKKRVRIHEIHMEEDAGKLIHSDGGTLINYNRAGVPLLEIVSEPDLANGSEAAEYTEKLRLILLYCGISDCKMQEGSLRADVNVSVHKKGETALGTRTEMKNLASFKAIKAAVDSEAKRQTEIIKSGKEVRQQTRRWDEDRGVSFLMREKEEANDYKYFPEPDIPPLNISDDYIGRISASLPELPDEKRARYISYGLSEYDADVICRSVELCELFDSTLEITGLPKDTANWLLGEVMFFQKAGKGLPESTALGEVIRLCADKKITRESAKEALAASYEGTKPSEYIKARGLEIANDNALVGQIINAVIVDNEKAVGEYLGGKEKSLNYLVGQCMRALKGRADASELRKLINEYLNK